MPSLINMTKEDDILTELETHTSSLFMERGHNCGILEETKSCLDSSTFTDVTIICYDGSIKAHRLILASGSPFLCQMLKEADQSSTDSEISLIIPDINKEVMMSIVNFLYTGKMLLDHDCANTWLLHHMVQILKIDPNDVVLEQSESSASINDSQWINHSGAAPTLKSKPSAFRTASFEPLPSSGAFKPSKATKTFKKEQHIGFNDTTIAHKSTNRLSLHKRLSASSDLGPTTKTSKIAKIRKSLKSTSTGKPSGIHDLTNMTTWVCAICKCYDPIFTPKPEPDGAADFTATENLNTDWIGCDCDRWYHQYCTKLTTFDDNFSCATVNLPCMSPPKC